MNNLSNDIQEYNLTDGFFNQNIVFTSGMVTASIVAAANTLQRGIVLSLGFGLISLLTILIGSFISKRLVYTVRIILYALIGAVAYIPVAFMLKTYYSIAFADVLIFIQLMAINPLILSKTESRFYNMAKTNMMIDVIVFIFGYVVVAIVMGGIRELLSFGTIGGLQVLTKDILPSAVSPFFGFILVGIIAALARYLIQRSKEGSL